ncbi:MAG TPA: hypothetical protein VF503_01270 [Sphingobium sp.]|uniref:hypothetical protein n=1 Tax=Sphingobium sp. TaxID=1912891 RepID=UPI002ED5568E
MKRSPIADQLERASDQLDRLIHDLRLTPHPHADRYHALEERAQAIASAIVAPFRGEQPPVAQPHRLVTENGRTRAIW